MLRVRITKATLPTYWYAGKVGEVFSVNKKTFRHGIQKLRDSYKLHRRNLLIDVDDCEVVEP